MTMECPHCGGIVRQRHKANSRQTEFIKRQYEICDKFGHITYHTLYDAFPKYTPPQIWSTANELARTRLWEKIDTGIFKVDVKKKRKHNATKGN